MEPSTVLGCLVPVTAASWDNKAGMGWRAADAGPGVGGWTTSTMVQRTVSRDGRWQMAEGFQTWVWSVSKRADDVNGLFDDPLPLAKTHREWSPTLVSAVN